MIYHDYTPPNPMPSNVRQSIDLSRGLLSEEAKENFRAFLRQYILQDLPTIEGYLANRTPLRKKATSWNLFHSPLHNKLAEELADWFADKHPEAWDGPDINLCSPGFLPLLSLAFGCDALSPLIAPYFFAPNGDKRPWRVLWTLNFGNTFASTHLNGAVSQAFEPLSHAEEEGLWSHKYTIQFRVSDLQKQIPPARDSSGCLHPRDLLVSLEDRVGLFFPRKLRCWCVQCDSSVLVKA